jgi:hypothetical protein
MSPTTAPPDALAGKLKRTELQRSASAILGDPAVRNGRRQECLVIAWRGTCESQR